MDIRTGETVLKFIGRRKGGDKSDVGIPLLHSFLQLPAKRQMESTIIHRFSSVSVSLRLDQRSKGKRKSSSATGRSLAQGYRRSRPPIGSHGSIGRPTNRN